MNNEEELKEVELYYRKRLLTECKVCNMLIEKMHVSRHLTSKTHKKNDLKKKLNNEELSNILIFD